MRDSAWKLRPPFRTRKGERPARPGAGLVAFGAVRKMDAIFMLERSINGLSPEERLAARRRGIAPPVDNLIDWMKQERAQVPPPNETAKAMEHMLKRIDPFSHPLATARNLLRHKPAQPG